MSSAAKTRSHKGILSEILKTPACKDILRTNLNSIDAKTARPLVRTILWQDPEVLLGIMSTLPALVNAGIHAASELGRQIQEKYPPKLLIAFMRSLYCEIDKDALTECKKVWTSLLQDLWEACPELRKDLKNAIVQNAPGKIADRINAFSRGVNSLNESQPDILSTFLHDLLGNIDGNEFSKATHCIADALLDQKYNTAPWMWQLAVRRLKKRFSKKMPRPDTSRWDDGDNI